MSKKLLCVFVVVFFLSLSGCVPQKQGESPPAGGQKEVIKPEVQAPEGWLKYENQSHKFSFYYPPDWQLIPEIERDDLLTFSLEFNDTSQEQKTFWDNSLGYPYYSLAVRVEDNPENMSALDWAVKQYLPQSQEEMRQKYTPVAIGSHQFIKDSGPVTPDGVYFGFQTCPGNAKAYSFVHRVDASKATEQKYLAEVEKILTTLQFTE